MIIEILKLLIFVLFLLAAGLSLVLPWEVLAAIAGITIKALIFFGIIGLGIKLTE